MYLHIGNNVTVFSQDVVAIFDLDNASTSAITRSFLRQAEEEGMVIAAGEELPKSIVLCCPQGSWQRVYLSPLSSAALAGRLESHAVPRTGRRRPPNESSPSHGRR